LGRCLRLGKNGNRDTLKGFGLTQSIELNKLRVIRIGGPLKGEKIMLYAFNYEELLVVILEKALVRGREQV
jgi:hypothetical protein